MNTFFQERDVYKYTWCRDYLDQRSFTDFCIIYVDLFRSVLDVCVKRGAELSTITTWWSATYTYKSHQGQYKYAGPGHLAE